ncbi:MAG: nucleotide pyrophosphohydrolase [Planctomycetes bacterium]|nr:nucleotide pyrophosphohydrolase [Planctomycetota bacterium]
MHISEFQKMIEKVYGAKDRQRGQGATFQWFAEEVGELAKALRKGKPENVREEFADVLAWLVTLANMNGVDLEEALRGKYPGTCIKCGNTPCACKEGAA